MVLIIVVVLDVDFLYFNMVFGFWFMVSCLVEVFICMEIKYDILVGIE